MKAWKAWHFTDGMKLRNGEPVPGISVPLEWNGPLVMCESGLHASESGRAEWTWEARPRSGVKQ